MYGQIIENGSRSFFKVLSRTSNKITVMLVDSEVILNLDTCFLEGVSFLSVVR